MGPTNYSIISRHFHDPGFPHVLYISWHDAGSQLHIKAYVKTHDTPGITPLSPPFL